MPIPPPLFAFVCFLMTPLTPSTTSVLFEFPKFQLKENPDRKKHQTIEHPFRLMSLITPAGHEIFIIDCIDYRH